MMKKTLTAIMLAATPIIPVAAQQNPEAVVEHQSSQESNSDFSHDYSLNYFGLKGGDVQVAKKSFSPEDFPANTEDITRLLQTYDASELETMSFSFSIRNAGKAAKIISSFWDNAVFKTIVVNENGTKRPVLATADLRDRINNYHEEWLTIYDRKNFTVTQKITKTGEETETHENTYEESVFRQILDPLTIIHELMTQQPRAINEDRLNVGYFFSSGNGNTQHENLLGVQLTLVDEDKEWNGEITLPEGVFLKENSVRVRVQYRLNNGILVPSYNNRLYLKPGSGALSYIPDWAYTKPK